MQESRIMATEREHELVRLVKVKLRLNPDYVPDIEELVATNAVRQEQAFKDAVADPSDGR